MYCHIVMHKYPRGLGYEHVEETYSQGYAIEWYIYLHVPERHGLDTTAMIVKDAQHQIKDTCQKDIGK